MLITDDFIKVVLKITCIVLCSPLNIIIKGFWDVLWMILRV